MNLLWITMSGDPANTAGLKHNHLKNKFYMVTIKYITKNINLIKETIQFKEVKRWQIHH